MARACRVLSIQSHVVHGYVGNKSAVFPLQRLGFEVDFVNSVQFSNHTGYPSFKGAVMDGQQLGDVMAGLEANSLADHTHLLTGYIGSKSFLQQVVQVLQTLRRANADVTYVCDPVLGDSGKLYVPQELIECYRQDILPLASIMTPNQYEAELLVGFALDTQQAALRACQAMHDRGPHTVVITSFYPEGEEADSMALIASTTLQQQQGQPGQFRIRVPRVDAYFTGTGDLLAALLLANIELHPGNLVEAVERSLASTQGILLATVDAAGDAARAKDRTPEVCKRRELRLIQNQHLLVEPDIKLRAEPI